MAAMTQQDFTEVHCETPGCNHHVGEPFFFNQRCHPRTGTDVQYHRGVLTIMCHTCRRTVAEIAVAKDPELPA